VAGTDVKEAFDLAAGAFVTEVRAVGPQRLTDPGTAQWSVAELIGHGARGIACILSGRAWPAGGNVLS
jgi:hypothetical protein